MQTELFPAVLRLNRIDLKMNMRRLFSLSLQPGLFGDWAVVGSWRRLGSIGRTRVDLYCGAGEALDSIVEIRKSKLKRRYIIDCLP